MNNLHCIFDISVSLLYAPSHYRPFPTYSKFINECFINEEIRDSIILPYMTYMERPYSESDTWAIKVIIVWTGKNMDLDNYKTILKN